jgi:hypothetical protein
MPGLKAGFHRGPLPGIACIRIGTGVIGAQYIALPVYPVILIGSGQFYVFVRFIGIDIRLYSTQIFPELLILSGYRLVSVIGYLLPVSL